MFDFNVTQTAIESGFVSALVIFLRIAEKRLDLSRNGPLYPRVRHLEGKFNELEIDVEDIKRGDIIDRLDKAEASLRRIARENAR